MRWRLAVTLTTALSLGGVLTAAAQDSRPGVAVLTFENGGSYGQDAEDFEALRVGLQQILITELARNDAMRVVERGRISALLQEQDLAEAGRVDPGTAAQLGRLVGAKYMVLGGFVDFYGDFRIDARVVDVETGELVNTERVADQRENLYQLVVTLATRLTETVSLPPLEDAAGRDAQAREIPSEALGLYSRALYFEERNQPERAIEFYSRAVEIFPAFTEAQEGLQQLRQS